MSRGYIVALRDCGSLLAVWAVDGDALWLRTFGLAFELMIAKPRSACVELECTTCVDWIGFELN